MRSLDRRTFLALGVGAAAWACARGTDTRDDTERRDISSDPISVVTTALALAPGDTRQAFAVFRGQRPSTPDDLEVRLIPPEGRSRAVEVRREEVLRGPGGGDSHDHPEGTEVTDIFVVNHDFAVPGVWNIEVTLDDGRASGAFEVVRDMTSPLVGEKAIATVSPTEANPRGVDPICTRTPACSMHELTIADALEANKPTVIIFATPRFCTSRTCGPVVDFVQEQADRVGDAASFVHVEIWKDDDEAVNKPPQGWVEAFADWKFGGTEPWIYFVGPDGVVKDRWLGAVGPNEVRRAVDELVG